MIGLSECLRRVLALCVPQHGTEDYESPGLSTFPLSTFHTKYSLAGLPPVQACPPSDLPLPPALTGISSLRTPVVCDGRSSSADLEEILSSAGFTLLPRPSATQVSRTDGLS